MMSSYLFANLPLPHPVQIACENSPDIGLIENYIDAVTPVSKIF